MPHVGIPVPALDYLGVEVRVPGFCGPLRARSTRSQPCGPAGLRHGKRCVTIEPDARHAELIVDALGLTPGQSKAVRNPGVRRADEDVERRLCEPALGPGEARVFRYCGTRATFIIIGRPDVVRSCEGIGTAHFPSDAGPSWRT